MCDYEDKHEAVLKVGKKSILKFFRKKFASKKKPAPADAWTMKMFGKFNGRWWAFLVPLFLPRHSTTKKRKVFTCRASLSLLFSGAAHTISLRCSFVVALCTAPKCIDEGDFVFFFSFIERQTPTRGIRRAKPHPLAIALVRNVIGWGPNQLQRRLSVDVKIKSGKCIRWTIFMIRRRRMTFRSWKSFAEKTFRTHKKKFSQTTLLVR